MRYFLTFFFVLLTTVGCSSKEKTLVVAATAVPHAELLEAVKPDLEGEGIRLKIVEVDDYNLPNRLLYEKQIDANFFQHAPFLDEQNRRFGYNLRPLVDVHIEPLAIYSCKMISLEELQEGAIIAIPSDPTNEARALTLLQDINLIKLKGNNGLVTIYDIEENSRRLRIEEVDAAFLPRALSDVDLAVIPANFSLQVHLNPMTDALAVESSCSPYANIVAIRAGEEEREEIKLLKKALTSEKLRTVILEKYKGALIPALS